ncbi:MAG: ABC transporter permease [Chelatococcus sp.]|jgi:peptide/nickel transport system permease protein|uniref:ABC transporter permease n=1 Tax=unclassified Chelatococcus TaxID=2638111 RepID=UPI001BCB0AD0|nr:MULTISPECIES: ABC transporter permease [unclassified Chelatococcus]CAH1648329.1 Glutathione transport system permease protein GsiC [Hyphomicrobiales bacterium]MBS7741987.1 ABC transporter permease [Chelatococcus sp. HY11]MBX3540685.1 ABC transporter permease [Chelatococcus sp.]MBX3541215.1 ABC transporter permease [Chelatococcus sp.]MCO5074892.1 ABC transporter permease [Chelatococcus sp.]
MSRYVIERLGEALVAVWGIVTIVFVVTRMLGDPAVLLLPLGTPEAQVAALRAELGLERPMIIQYLDFLIRAVQGDFGLSYQFFRPAMDLVLERLPATAILAGTSIVLGVIIGSLAGFVAAVKRGSFLEFLAMTVALLGQATPVFWLGIMLILYFGVNLGWLPTGGWDSLASLVLPVLTLSIFVAATVSRLFRSSMLDALSEDYVRTARAKGLPPGTVYTRHAGRNALIPVVTMVAILTAELLGGSAVTETVFSWPGVGRLLLQAIENKDFPVIQAGVFLIAVIFVGTNLLIDLIYPLLDPRIRVTR